MANIIRSAKSGADWTHGDTDAYNIHLSFEDVTTFFGVAQLPAPIIENEILTVEDADNAVSDTNHYLLSPIDAVMNASNPEESIVNYFAVSLFHAMGSLRRPRLAHTRNAYRENA